MEKTYFFLLVYLVYFCVTRKDLLLEWFLFKTIKNDDRGPVFPQEQYPELAPVKQKWKTILDEFERNKGGGSLKPIIGDRYFSENIIKSDKWKRVYLKWYGKPWSNEDAFPKTTSLLKQIPRLRAAMFSCMEPGTVVEPHKGPNPASIRVHLGLQIPKDSCFIMVDGKRYTWKNGEMMLFDDTYTHSVRNDSNEDRVILFLDIERDDRPITRIVNQIAAIVESTSSR